MSLASKVSLSALSLALFATACDDETAATVILDDDYAPSTTGALVVYSGQFETASFSTPAAPGGSTEAESSIPTSGDRAYVLVAPGWDPASGRAPASFLLLESIQAFSVRAGDVVHIPVDDSAFRGNCATGAALAQAEADLVIQSFFADTFTNKRFDAATCTTTTIYDASDGQ